MRERVGRYVTALQVYVAPGLGSIRELVMECGKEQRLSHTHAPPSQSVCWREREGEEEHPELRRAHRPAQGNEDLRVCKRIQEWRCGD